MSGQKASAGSWTIVTPPIALTRRRPAVPSSCAPVRTTPATRGPYTRAAERKSGSIAGRQRFSRAAPRRTDDDDVAARVGRLGVAAAVTAPAVRVRIHDSSLRAVGALVSHD